MLSFILIFLFCLHLIKSSLLVDSPLELQVSANMYVTQFMPFLGTSSIAVNMEFEKEIIDIDGTDHCSYNVTLIGLAVDGEQQQAITEVFRNEFQILLIEQIDCFGMSDRREGGRIYVFVTLKYFEESNLVIVHADAGDPQIDVTGFLVLGWVNEDDASEGLEIRREEMIEYGSEPLLLDCHWLDALIVNSDTLYTLYSGECNLTTSDEAFILRKWEFMDPNKYPNDTVKTGLVKDYFGELNDESLGLIELGNDDENLVFAVQNYIVRQPFDLSRGRDLFLVNETQNIEPDYSNRCFRSQNDSDIFYFFSFAAIDSDSSGESKIDFIMFNSSSGEFTLFDYFEGYEFDKLFGMVVDLYFDDMFLIIVNDTSSLYANYFFLYRDPLNDNEDNFILTEHTLKYNNEQEGWTGFWVEPHPDYYFTGMFYQTNPEVEWNPDAWSDGSSSYVEVPVKLGGYAYIPEVNIPYFTGYVYPIYYSICPPSFYYSNHTTTLGVCSRCPEPTFQEHPTFNGDGSCTATCPLGKFVDPDNFDSSRCKNCSVGTYSSEGISVSSQCTPCPPGLFGVYPGQTEFLGCVACQNQTFNPLEGMFSSNSCVACPDIEGYHCPLASNYPMPEQIEENDVTYSAILYDDISSSPFNSDFWKSSLMWKLIFTVLMFNGCVFLLIILVCLSFLPDKQIQKNRCLRCCCYYVKFENLDFHFSDRHDVENLHAPIRRKTFMGGFFSLVVFFVAITLVLFSLFDFFLDNVSAWTNTKLNLEKLEKGAFTGNFAIQMAMKGEFSTGQCSDSDSSMEYVGPRGYDGVKTAQFGCSLGGIGCICSWVCNDCDFYELLDDTKPIFDIYVGGMLINRIEYQISVPHHTGSAFVTTGIVEELTDSINELDFEVSVIPTQKSVWSAWNYFLAPVGIEDIYTITNGMSTPIRKAQKITGGLNLYLKISFEFLLSDLKLIEEEKPDQGLLNLVAQIFALFGLSVTIVGLFYSRIDTCCVKYKDDRDNILLLQKVLKNKKLLLKDRNSHAEIELKDFDLKDFVEEEGKGEVGLKDFEMKDFVEIEGEEVMGKENEKMINEKIEKEESNDDDDDDNSDDAEENKKEGNDIEEKHKENDDEKVIDVVVVEKEEKMEEEKELIVENVENSEVKDDYDELGGVEEDEIDNDNDNDEKGKEDEEEEGEAKMELMIKKMKKEFEEKMEQMKQFVEEKEKKIREDWRNMKD